MMTNVKTEIEIFLEKFNKQLSFIRIEYTTHGYENHLIYNGYTKVIPEVLATINYYSGYGMQHIYGYMLFTDNSWATRHEYDGAEYWVLQEPPKPEPTEHTTDTKTIEYNGKSYNILPIFNYIATNYDGAIYLYINKPIIGNGDDFWYDSENTGLMFLDYIEAETCNNWHETLMHL